MHIFIILMGRDRLLSLGIKITPITDTIFVIHGNNRSRSPFSNTICILDQNNMLMDTGCGIELLTQMSDVISFDKVILSHSHPDHTGGTWLFQRIPGVEITVPREGSESIGSADRLALRFVGHDLAQHWKETYLPVTRFRDFTPRSTFHDGSEFLTGENRFIALHTPGHLQDHYCFWEPDKKILIGFDIDLSPFGPWYGNPESDIPLFKKSITMIKSLPVETYISSHARPMKYPHFLKRIDAYTSVFDERDRKILNLVPEEGGITLDELVVKSPIYNVDYNLHPDRMLKFGETRIIEKHLLGFKTRGIIADDGHARFRKRSGL
jgi:glyoxylase-like metal-dependent hydrolase (beta-lactamase superfamily II)